jgi:hypothetical protein
LGTSGNTGTVAALMFKACFQGTSASIGIEIGNSSEIDFDSDFDFDTDPERQWFENKIP